MSGVVLVVIGLILFDGCSLICSTCVLRNMPIAPMALNKFAERAIDPGILYFIYFHFLHTHCMSHRVRFFVCSSGICNEHDDLYNHDYLQNNRILLLYFKTNIQSTAMAPYNCLLLQSCLISGTDVSV
jgi:hypothetical protein